MKAAEMKKIGFMTSDELNVALVTQVFGWEKREGGYGRKGWLAPVEGGLRERGRMMQHWSWSSSLFIDLVKKLEAAGYRIVVTFDPKNDYTYARVTSPSGVMAEWDHGQPGRAVCVAALMACNGG